MRARSEATRSTRSRSRPGWDATICWTGSSAIFPVSSTAVDRQGILDATAEGAGIFNPAVPAAFKDWSIPIDQLTPDGRVPSEQEAQRMV